MGNLKKILEKRLINPLFFKTPGKRKNFKREPLKEHQKGGPWVKMNRGAIAGNVPGGFFA